MSPQRGLAFIPESRSLFAMIRFLAHTQTSALLNPMMGGQLDTQTLEIRRDPLTGAQAVFNPRLEDKVAMFLGPSDQALIERLAKQSEGRCFLCGENWRQATPKYPPAICPDGRFISGEAVLFPNLFPVSQVHAVLRACASHYLPLHAFTPALLRDAFDVSFRFIREMVRVQPEVAYLTVNANYLAPAGASIAHPHFQVVGGDLPCTYLEQVGALAKAYREREGSCYFRDLAETELSEGKRFLGTTRSAKWFSAFAPQGANEVWGVLPERSDFLQLEEADVQSLADGLSRVLRGYASLGISTFNFTLYSGKLGASDDHLRCYLRVISRQNFYENYRTDDYFLQKLLRNELILITPEALTTKLKPLFAE